MKEILSAITSIGLFVAGFTLVENAESGLFYDIKCGIFSKNYETECEKKNEETINKTTATNEARHPKLQHHKIMNDPLFNEKFRTLIKNKGAAERQNKTKRQKNHAKKEKEKEKIHPLTPISIYENTYFNEIPTSPSPTISNDNVYVEGYFRKDGTYVRGHYRSSPDKSFNNNWSTKGNYNPYTGKKGYKKRKK